MSTKRPFSDSSSRQPRHHRQQHQQPQFALDFNGTQLNIPPWPDSLVLGRSAALAIGDLLVSRQHCRISALPPPPPPPSDDSHGAPRVSVTQLGLRSSMVAGSLLARGAHAHLSLGEQLVLVPPAKFVFTLVKVVDSALADVEIDDEPMSIVADLDTRNDVVDLPHSLPSLPTIALSLPPPPPTNADQQQSQQPPPPPPPPPPQQQQESQQRRHLSAFDAEVLHFAESLVLGADADDERALTDRERQWLVDAASTLRSNLGDLLVSDRQCMQMCQAFVRALLTGDSGVADAVLESRAWYWYTAQAALRDARAARCECCRCRQSCWPLK
jgi:hypothetical protein